jgi:hypothetical protein
MLVDVADLEVVVETSQSRLVDSHEVSGGVKVDVRVMPAARPLPATTSAIFRDASSIISSPSTADPLAPPAAEVA